MSCFNMQLVYQIKGNQLPDADALREFLDELDYLNLDDCNIKPEAIVKRWKQRKKAYQNKLWVHLSCSIIIYGEHEIYAAEPISFASDIPEAMKISLIDMAIKNAIEYWTKQGLDKNELQAAARWFYNDHTLKKIQEWQRLPKIHPGLWELVGDG